MININNVRESFTKIGELFDKLTQKVKTLITDVTQLKEDMKKVKQRLGM